MPPMPAAIAAVSLVVTCSIARADVSALAIDYEGNVADLVDPVSGETIGNESFAGAGGVELLPVAEAGAGGDGFFVAGVSLAASGSLGPGGSLSLTQSLGSSVEGLFDFDDAVAAANVLSTVTFSVSEPRAFSLSIDEAFFDNALGSASFSLVQDGFGTIAEPDFLLPFPQVFAGTLEPGNYTVSAAALGEAGVSYGLNVIPAPSGALVLAGAGVVGLRRRR